MMSLGLSLIGGALGTVGNFLGGKGGSVISGIGNMLGIQGANAEQQRAEQRQFENEKEMMGLQAKYNEKMANANQQRAKEMWDYTNYENQVKHMKSAGLSVGLMYGNGGGMGASTAGGQGSGISNSGTTAVAAGLQAQQIGLNIRQMEAQTRLAEAQADKATAEAKKTAGADTQLAETTVKNLIAQTNNEEERRKLIKQQARLELINGDLAEETLNFTEDNRNLVKAQIKKTVREGERLLDEIKSLKMDNKIKNETMENVINQQAIQTAQMIKNITKTTAETKAIYAGINKMVADVILTAEGNQIKWNELENDLTKYLGEMGIKDEQIKQGYLGVITQAVAGLGQLGIAYKLITGNAMPKNLKIPKIE
ncbi:DNA pilot protein [Microvirus mar40]|uniref:DNA pilot protein n=1 Tax=Microvirus mar40 TaxID=2851175 RepID=A0A8F5XT69_9VIRU|nr:DNA pilot protein [Microvirus mar40]